MTSRDLALVALFTALTAIGAFIKIPLPVVPITLQTIFVIMAGLLLGPRLGALSQALYLGLGLIGLPVFTQGSGPGYLLKPSFGYLLGFIAAAYLSGFIIQGKEVNFKNTCLAAFTGVGIIYLLGLPYLYLILTKIMGMELTIMETLKTGMLIFLPGDLLKVLLISILIPKIYSPLNKSNHFSQQ